VQGFDPRFRDPPDFILGVTKEIWEDRGIATLRNYYAPDIPVRSPASVVVGNQGVIAATMATLAEFPDRQLLGEDVIWCGDDNGGFLSSHRLISTATHAADGAYGPASGRHLSYRIIAECYARENQIRDEWLVRDQGAIVRQMGLDPKRYAADWVASGTARPLTPANDPPGPYRGVGNESPWGECHADILSGIMAADFASIPKVYDRAVQLEMPGGTTGHGWGSVDGFWLRLRSAFPSCEFRIHHRVGREDPLCPPRSAIRWSLWGKHDGFGAFGPPTGAPVYVLGMSQAEFGPDGLRREWVLYDEVAIWAQIVAHTG
jgi:predicted ester cyclase